MSITDTEVLITETIQSLNQLTQKLYSLISSTVHINPNPSAPINPTPASPSGSGNLIPSIDLTSVQDCVVLNHIIDEKPGAELFNVILTVNDFNILKQNDHVFVVIPVNPLIIKAVPTMGIHSLTGWIAANSITQVPDTPSDNV